jgi:hypothetical protein
MEVSDQWRDAPTVVFVAAGMRMQCSKNYASFVGTGGWLL